MGPRASREGLKGQAGSCGEEVILRMRVYSFILYIALNFSINADAVLTPSDLAICAVGVGSPFDVCQHKDTASEALSVQGGLIHQGTALTSKECDSTSPACTAQGHSSSLKAREAFDLAVESESLCLQLQRETVPLARRQTMQQCFGLNCGEPLRDGWLR